jgi:hypothetical protein
MERFGKAPVSLSRSDTGSVLTLATVAVPPPLSHLATAEDYYRHNTSVVP